MTSHNNTNNEQQIQIVILNCNSIYGKITEVKDMLNTYEPELLCLTETWIENDKYLPKFHNYQTEWKHRVGRGGGLGIIIHRDIQYKSFELNLYNNGLLEVQAIQLYLKDGSSMNILNLYNPNENITAEEFQHYFNQLGNKYVVTGDFNAHSRILAANERNNSTGTALENTLLNQQVCLINPINLYTYTDRRSGKQSCLDLCLTSPNLAPITDISQFLDLGSDHISLMVTLQIVPFRVRNINRPKWKMNKQNMEAFTQHYIPCTDVRPADIDTIASDLANRILESARETMSATNINHTPKRRTPWWNSRCATAVNSRRRAFKKFQKHPTMENLEDYITKNNNTKTILKEEKEESLQKYISSLTHEAPQGMVWKKIRAFKSTYTINNFPIENNDVQICDPVTKANMFCEHYKREGEENITNETPYHEFIDDRKKLVTDNYIYQPFSEYDLMRAMNKLKNKTPGQDGITNALIKIMNQEYLEELLALYNQSYITGCVPHTWKSGIVLPIPKPNKCKKDISSYRPITLLSCLGKLLERLIQKRLEYHIETNKYLQSFQHGFRPSQGTDDILLRLHSKIRDTLSNKKYCGVVYVDLKGAFDRVWRHGLMYKIARIGISGNMLKWLESYLEDRNITVSVNGHLSNKLILDAGVPQGAVLSPILFNIMCSDIPHINDVNMYIFADDITFSFETARLDDLATKLQEYCNLLENWCEQWKFTISIDKTKLQVFTRKRERNIQLSICNLPIKQTKVQKLLGVHLDAPFLTFKEHIEYLKANCTKRINIMKSISSLKYGASRIMLRRFYIAYIRPKICYGSSIFYNASKTLIQRLNSLQNFCLRLSSGARKTTPIVALEAECNVPPLSHYFQYSATKILLKILHRPAEDITLKEIKDLYLNNHLNDNSYMNEVKIKTLKIKEIPIELKLASPLENETYINHNINDLSDEDSFRRYVRERFLNHTIIYTDGSKIDHPQTSVAAGFFVENLSIAACFKLHPDHTVVAAELFAIHKALQYVQNYINGDCVVFTDSQSALQAIEGTSKSYLHITENIRKLILLLSTEHGISLHWVRGHCGIRGNVVADKMANLGHENDRSAIFPLCLEEHLCSIRKIFLNHWNNYWKREIETTQKGLHNYNIRNNVNEEPPTENKSRRKDCAIIRLRLGHAGLNQHLHRFNLAPTPYCDHCGSRETIEHYLINCEQYDDQRGRLVYRIMKLIGYMPQITIRLLLGGEKFPKLTNKKITEFVADYLAETGRLQDI